LPHTPQFPESVVTLTHAEPQSVVPPAQLTPHSSAEQTSPLSQTVEHIPQLLGSV
jgi:hypothetical protein